MRVRRVAGRPVAPLMDEVAEDVHRLTEMVVFLSDKLGLGQMAEPDEFERFKKLLEHLRGRFEAQKKELENEPSRV